MRLPNFLREPQGSPTEALQQTIAVSSSRPFDSYPVSTQEEAMRRRAYVDALCAQASVSYTTSRLEVIIQRVAQTIGDSRPPSASSLYRWHRALVKNPDDLRVLIPRFDARGGHGHRMSDEILALLDDVISRLYLTLQRRPMTSVMEALRIRVAQENTTRSSNRQLTLPSYATIKRYIRSLPKYDVDLARYGREYARKKYRHSSISPLATYLLERVEIDHTPLNLFVIDEETFLALGRPYVTWMIDCYSRMILGFYISFAPPSIDAVFRCMKHGFENKRYAREHYPDINHDWPCYGIPKLVVVDNGLEFHSKDLRRATFELKIDYQFCPPRTPWFKPIVERSLRSLAEQFAHLMPGTSFANWFDRYGYDPLKEGVVTMPELVHALHVWIIDVYAQTYHRGIKQTPYAAWKKGEELCTPRKIATERLTLALSQQANRVLGHAGIELHGLRYNNEDMLVLRKQLGHRLKIQVRFDPEDLGLVNVLHPLTKEPIPVPCLTPEYANGLRLYQHQLIQKAIRREGLRVTDPLALAKAKQHMQDIVGNLLRSNKLNDRKKGAKAKGSNSSLKTLHPRPYTLPETNWDAPFMPDIPPAELAVITLDREDSHE